MKTFFALLGLMVLLLGGGCVVEPAYPSAGASVGVYGEYPYSYYGHGGYYPRYRYQRWHHPYDRDHYYYRHYRYGY